LQVVTIVLENGRSENSQEQKPSQSREIQTVETEAYGVIKAKE